MSDKIVSDEEISMLRRLCDAASPAPWKAMIEGREFTSGDSFVMIGDGDGREDDMYVSRDSRPASAADLDLIAAGRNYLPRLLDEIERLRRGTRGST